MRNSLQTVAPNAGKGFNIGRVATLRRYMVRILRVESGDLLGHVSQSLMKTTHASMYINFAEKEKADRFGRPLPGLPRDIRLNQGYDSAGEKSLPTTRATTGPEKRLFLS